MLNKKSKTLQLGQFIALLASLLIVGQMGFILYQGTPFCLNGGCKVVEQLTRVSPLIFNLAGFFFFQVVFWGLRVSHNEPRRVPQVVKTLLLAGLAVEAVLLSFQYLVAQAFCAYCLGIFAFIIVLNLLLGFKQALPGVFLFAAVALAFASLELNQPGNGQQAFTAGVFATRPGSAQGPEHFLFYSSTCAHCEKVIAALKENPRVTVHFNPVDQVKHLDLPGTTFNDKYSAAANRGLLASLGIDEIPVLITRTPEGLTIRRGETALFTYFGQMHSADPAEQSGSSTAPASPSVTPGLESKDGCAVSTECTDGTGGAPPPSAR